MLKCKGSFTKVQPELGSNFPLKVEDQEWSLEFKKWQERQSMYGQVNDSNSNLQCEKDWCYTFFVVDF